jgi:hypothetical protein
MRVVVAVLLSCLVTSGALSAQTHAGVRYSALAQEYPDQTRSGVGAFVVFTPRDWLGIDVSTDWFLAEDVGGAAWQVLAGPRAGVRWRDLGLFGRIRPGFVRFSERFFKPNIACILIFPPPEACLAPHTNLALDVGGTVEVPVGPRTRVRLDLGDTLIGVDRGTLEPEWTHNLQFGAGVGWRF